MVKIIMKHVPKKVDQGTQHEVLKRWSFAVVESHPSKKHIRIISAKTMIQKRDDSGT